MFKAFSLKVCQFFSKLCFILHDISRLSLFDSILNSSAMYLQLINKCEIEPKHSNSENSNSENSKTEFVFIWDYVNNVILTLLF